MPQQEPENAFAMLHELCERKSLECVLPIMSPEGKPPVLVIEVRAGGKPIKKTAVMPSETINKAALRLYGKMRKEGIVE